MGHLKITPLYLIEQRRERETLKAAGAEHIIKVHDALIKSVTKGRTISIPSVQSQIRNGQV